MRQKVRAHERQRERERPMKKKTKKQKALAICFCWVVFWAFVNFYISRNYVKDKQPY